MQEERPTTYNILFVCTGNTCRSPLAEVIARRAVEERRWTYVRIDSAGTAAIWDAPASDGSLAAAKQIGLDLSGHRSQPISGRLVSDADLILGMTPNHVHTVEAMGGDGKAYLISEFIDGSEAGEPIRDPIGGPPEQYEEARDRIIRSVDALLDRLAAILSP